MPVLLIVFSAVDSHFILLISKNYRRIFHASQRRPLALAIILFLIKVHFVRFLLLFLIAVIVVALTSIIVFWVLF